MPKRRPRQARAKEPDPRDDLPNAPAMRNGLYKRPVEQHRRGCHQAVRAMPWEGIGLSKEEISAAEKYADLCHRHRPSPAPKSCLDLTPGGDDDSEPTPADVAAEREWSHIQRELRKCGMRPHAEIERVCWLQEACRDVGALRIALEVLC